MAETNIYLKPSPPCPHTGTKVVVDRPQLDAPSIHTSHTVHTHTHTHLWIRYTHADRQKHAEAEAHTQTHTHTHTQRRPEFGRWVIAAEKLIHAQLSSLTFNKNKKQTNKRRQIRVLFNLSVAGFCFRSKKRTLEPPLTRKGQLLGERTAVRLHVELLLKEIF